MRPLLEVLKENGEMYRHDAIDAALFKDPPRNRAALGGSTPLQWPKD